MVWEMFSWHYLNPFIIIDRTMYQRKNASLLSDNGQFYIGIVLHLNDGMHFQENAKCHSPHPLSEQFEKHQDNITIHHWEANYPNIQYTQS